MSDWTRLEWTRRLGPSRTASVMSHHSKELLKKVTDCTSVCGSSKMPHEAHVQKSGFMAKCVRLMGSPFKTILKKLRGARSNVLRQKCCDVLQTCESSTAVEWRQKHFVTTWMIRGWRAWR